MTDLQVLVTGGTGFIGSHVTRRLVDDGHTPRLLVRDIERASSLMAKMGVAVGSYEVVRGDITDADSVRAAVEGCDAVFHAAAVVAIDASRDAEMERTNLAGAENVLDAAVEAGCNPIVHMSSVAALFPFETDPVTVDHPVRGAANGYGRTKAACERHARAHQEAGAPVVTVYPSGVIGPGDWTGWVIQPALKFWIKLGFPVARRYSSSWVDVRDLAALVSACMKPGGGPQRLLAMGTYMSAREQVDVMSEAVGRRIRRVPLPQPFWWVWSRLGDLAARFGRDFVLTSDAYEYLFHFKPGDDSATVEATGVEFRPAVETWGDTYRWMVEAGVIDSRRLGVTRRS